MALSDAPVRVVLFPKMETLGGTCLNRQIMSLVLNLGRLRYVRDN